MSFQEELINEVRAHPIIWDKSCENYNNRLKSEKEWYIIARNLNKTTREVKSKWRNLRDVFQKELKKVRKPQSEDPDSPNTSNYSGKWIFYHQMLFLKDVMTPRLTQSNRVVGDEDYYITDTRQGEKSENFGEFENSTETAISDDDYENPAVTGECNVEIQSASMSSLESDSRSQRKKHKLTSVSSEFEASNMFKLEVEEIKPFNEKSKNIDDEDMLFLKSLHPYFRYLGPVDKLRLKSKFQILIADAIAATNTSSSTSPLPMHASASVSSWSQTRKSCESFNNDT